MKSRYEGISEEDWKKMTLKDKNDIWRKSRDPNKKVRTLAERWANESMVKSATKVKQI